MTVARDIMTPTPATVPAEATLAEAMRLLVEREWSGVPVVDAGELVGVISELALFDVMFDPRLKTARVRDYMTRDVRTVDENDSLGHVAHMFALYGIRRLPVMSRGRLAGLISRRDLLRFALQNDVALSDGFERLFERTDEPDNDGAQVERLLLDVHPTR
jgi:CBS domain-containing protein